MPNTTQKIKAYWNHKENGIMNPKKKVLPCTCGKLPSYYSSCGGFNFYGYYKCDDCNIFATGMHQFPNIGIDWGKNEDNDPKLFVIYNDETNAEDGWNNLIKALTKKD